VVRKVALREKMWYGKEGKKGATLIIAIFALFFISLLVITFLDTTRIDLQIVNNHTHDAQVTYIAEAGIEYAIYYLLYVDNNWTGTGGENPFAGGSYNVTVVINGSKRTIQSTGKKGEFKRVLRVKIRV
jgi:hypothetical protein